MTAKKFLSQARFYRAMIARLEAKIAEIRIDMESVRGISYDKIRVQGGTSDSVVHYLDQMMKLEEQLRNARARYYAAYNAILDAIDSLDSPLQRAIVAGRYLEGYSLKDIAEKLDYSFAYVQNQHGIALKNLVRNVE